MKKLLLLLTLVSFTMNAQYVLFEDDFNAEVVDAITFTNWSSVDNDGDGEFWEVMDADDYAAAGAPAFGMTGLAADSDSWEGSGFLPDNFLISTLIDFSSAAGTITLEYKVGTYQTNGNYLDDQYSIYLSDSDAIADILASGAIYNGMVGDLVAADQADGSASVATHTLDISSYAGGSYYLVYRHHDTFDMNSVLIDDVKVEATASSSVEDLLAEGFSYYPNPVSDALNMKANTAINTVSILNLLGQEVLNVTPNQLQSSIDFSNLNSGVYLVKVQIGNTNGTFKIVKK